MREEDERVIGRREAGTGITKRLKGEGQEGKDW